MALAACVPMQVPGGAESTTPIIEADAFLQLDMLAHAFELDTGKFFR